jgi:hypothetical protein
MIGFGRFLLDCSPKSGRSAQTAEFNGAGLSDACQWAKPTYSVEKLPRRFSLENAKALESLKFERADGPAISDDISSQPIVVRQDAR